VREVLPNATGPAESPNSCDEESASESNDAVTLSGLNAAYKAPLS
jgi:hypothetical protein